MNTQSRFVRFAGLVMIAVLLVGCGGGKGTVTIKASAETMQQISSWGDNIVVFTSATNPISSLEEVSVSKGEVGMWGPNPNEVKNFLQTIGQDLIGLKMIGAVGEGTTLFCDNPELRLFITLPDFEKNILDTGCGIKVVFEEN